MTGLNEDHEKLSAIVVGGSLSGLMTAIALAHKGIKVLVLEKSIEGARSGATLKVEGFSENGSETEKLLKEIVSKGQTSVQLWSSIEGNLRSAAHKDPNITLNYSTRVVSINEDDKGVLVSTLDGRTFKGDILVGADGHRSMVRKIVAPHHPHAEFAGFVVWMASIDKDALPNNKVPYPDEQVKVMNKDEGFLFGSVIKLENIEDQIGITWYDNTQTNLLYRLGAVKDKYVYYSVQGNAVPDEDLEIMLNQADNYWPEPWRSAVIYALKTRDFIGIPIKEYVPEKLTQGRFVLVGDAAHVPSPVTTKGFNESLVDAVVLSQCLSEDIDSKNVGDLLEKYESLRLRKMQKMVKSGQDFTQSFGRY